MNYDKCWNSSQVKKYFTTESRQKDRETFRKTHLPIEKIKVDTEISTAFTDSQLQDTEEGYFISEKDLRNSISQDANDVRLFFVEGAPGSGKSELCQWLEYEIEDSEDVRPIYISRRNAKSPSDIVKTLADAADTEIENIGNIEITDVVEEDFAAFCYHYILTKSAEYDKSMRNFLNDDEIEEMIISNIVNSLKSLKAENADVEFNPLPVDQLEDIQGRHTYLRNTSLSHVSQTADELLEERIKDDIGVDLEDALNEIADHFEQENVQPVLIIEDITSLPVFKYDFLKYFASISEGGWNVVIGLTRAFQSKIDEVSGEEGYIRDRTAGKLLMTGKKRQSYFLDENKAVDMVSEYMDALISETECGNCYHDINPLYPFNEAFIRHIYDNLQENNSPKQTPRLLLENVVKRLLENQKPPFISIQMLDSVNQRANYAESNFQEQLGSELNNMLTWYGVDDGETIKLEEETVKWFFPDGGGVEAPKVDSNIDFRREDGEEQDEEAEETIKDVVNEFLNWYNDNANFPRQQVLVKGIEELVDLYDLDFRALDSEDTSNRLSHYVRYTRGQEKVPIQIGAGGSTHPKLKITSEENQHILLALVKIGFLVEKGEEIDDAIKTVGPSTGLLYHWLETKQREFKQNLRERFSSDFNGLKPEELIYGMNFSVQNLACGALSVKEMYEATYTDYDSYLPISQIEDLKGYEDWCETFFRHRKRINQSFETYFTLRKSVKNPEKAEEIHEDILSIKEDSADLNYKRIPKYWKLGTSSDNRKLKNITKDYRNYLKNALNTMNISEAKKHEKKLEELKDEDLGPSQVLSIAKEISEFVGTGNITIYDTSDMEKIRDLSQQNTATEPDETHDFKGLIRKAEEVSDGFSYLSFLSGYLEVIQDPYYDQVMFLEGLLDNINQQIREEETEEVEKPEKWSEVKQGEKDLMEELEGC
jgi:hypothetical protein